MLQRLCAADRPEEASVYEIVGITDRGVEKSTNEDRIVLGGAVLSGGSLRIEHEAPIDVAVFDGVSTGGRANEATTIATQRYRDAVNEHAGDAQALVEAFGMINQEVVAFKNEKMPGETVATTVGALSIDADGNATALYAGDTRVYRLRDGRLEQLSHDHTILQRLKDENALELLAGIAASGTHVITRAIGRDDSNPIETQEAGATRPGDIYVLCSDGIIDGLLEAEPEHVQPSVFAARDAQECLSETDPIARRSDEYLFGEDSPAIDADDAAADADSDATGETAGQPLANAAGQPEQPQQPVPDGDLHEAAFSAPVDPASTDRLAGGLDDHEAGMTTGSQAVVTTSFPVQKTPASAVYDDERHVSGRITRILLGEGTLMERAERIVARATRGGSVDNVSVLLVRVCDQ